MGVLALCAGRLVHVLTAFIVATNVSTASDVRVSHVQVEACVHAVVVGAPVITPNAFVACFDCSFLFPMSLTILLHQIQACPAMMCMIWRRHICALHASVLLWAALHIIIFLHVDCFGVLVADLSARFGEVAVHNL